MLLLFRHVTREDHARTIRRQGEPGEIHVHVRVGLRPMPGELHVRKNDFTDGDETRRGHYVDPVLRGVGFDISTRYGVQQYGTTIRQLSNPGHRQGRQAYTCDDTRRIVRKKNISS